MVQPDSISKRSIPRDHHQSRIHRRALHSKGSLSRHAFYYSLPVTGVNDELGYLFQTCSIPKSALCKVVQIKHTKYDRRTLCLERPRTKGQTNSLFAAIVSDAPWPGIPINAVHDECPARHEGIYANIYQGQYR
jgi:hypothetical protein